MGGKIKKMITPEIFGAMYPPARGQGDSSSALFVV
jgi:hypothetical protein